LKKKSEVTPGLVRKKRFWECSEKKTLKELRTAENYHVASILRGETAKNWQEEGG